MEASGVQNAFYMSFCDHTYLVGPSRGPLILLLQEITRSMRLRGLISTSRQEVEWCTKSDGEGKMPQRIAG